MTDVADYLDDGTLTSAAWAAALQDGTLLGQQCRDCGDATAAPKAACASCGSRDIEAVALPTTGTVHSETTVMVAPTGFEAPYQVAVVTVGDARVMARIDGEVAIGDEVEFVDVVEGVGQPAPVFG